jgi:hypothetical protein
MWLLSSRPEVSKYLAAAGGPVEIFMAAFLGDTDLVDQCLSRQTEAISARVGVDNWTEFTGGGDKYIWVLGLYHSPHQLAFEQGHLETYQHLLDCSPPATQLLAACQCADSEAAKRIISEHPNLVENFPPEQMRSLADAAWEGKVESLRLMLELGFDPHTPGDHNSTPLDRAAFHGYREIVELLLEKDPSPPLSRQNEFGGMPLGTCLYGQIHGWQKDTDYPGTIRLLLEAGATYHPDWLPYPNSEIDEILKEYQHAAKAEG